jgi:hypothetical protein
MKQTTTPIFLSGLVLAVVKSVVGLYSWVMFLTGTYGAFYSSCQFSLL